MSKILKRPMFRNGGKANSKGTGITSGLEDRVPYQNAGLVDPSAIEKQMADLQALQEKFDLSYKRPEKLPTFGKPEYLRLAQFGLGLAGAPGGRSFGEILAEQAVPFLGDIATSMEAKRLREEQLDKEERAEKAKLFGTAYEDVRSAAELEKKIQAEKELQQEKIIGEKELQTGRYDLEKQLRTILGDQEMDRLIKEYDLKEALEKTKGQFDKDDKTFLSGFELEQLEVNMRKISEIDEALKNPGLSESEKQALNLDKNIAIEKLKRLKETDPVVDAFLNTDSGTFFTMQVEEALLKTINPETEKYWEKTDEGFYKKVIETVKKELGVSYAKGGRVGYQVGGMTPMTTAPTMNQPNQQSQVEMLGYNELRARLPREINNDIVQLLSVSAEALTDFAEIRTQEDVDNFNRKYSVNLVLPQEA